MVSSILSVQGLYTDDSAFYAHQEQVNQSFLSNQAVMCIDKISLALEAADISIHQRGGNSNDAFGVYALADAPRAVRGAA
jgi:hypothetical protein